MTNSDQSNQSATSPTNSEAVRSSALLGDAAQEPRSDNTKDPERSGAGGLPFFVFDVESIGLHGEGYAVGYVVASPALGELESGYYACDPMKASGDADDRAWVTANVRSIVPNCSGPNHVRVDFWRKWMEWKAKGAVMVSDCGWPVEARFLIACIEWDVDARKWEGPYPLHDVASVMLALGEDPLATRPRLANELPVHDPVADARQSARLLLSLVRRAAGAGWGDKHATQPSGPRSPSAALSGGANVEKS